MLLEYEIARIAGWIEDRILPPWPAADALCRLLSTYLQARGRQQDLTLFETFVRQRFEQCWAGGGSGALKAEIINRAVHLLYSDRPSGGEIVPMAESPSECRDRRASTVVYI